MTLPKLLAATACAILLTACEDENDRRIETYKKCKTAGMDTAEGIDGYGILTLYCKVPRDKP